MRTCHRHYPGRFDGACSLVPLRRRRPSLCNSQVGSCDCFFEACSAFTHVMACTLAESPCDPLHRRLRQLRCLRCRFDCYRVERTSSRAGVAPAESPAPFTAHCYVNYGGPQATSPFDVVMPQGVRAVITATKAGTQSDASQSVILWSFSYGVIFHTVPQPGPYGLLQLPPPPPNAVP